MRAVFGVRATEWWLRAEAAAMLIIVRLGLRILPYRTARQLLDRSAGPAAEGPSIEHVRRIARAVTVVARRLRGSTCLVQALAANVMLRRRGLASEISIGVRRSGSGTTKLEGHAWVEHDGTVILGAIDNLGDYRVMGTPDGGLSRLGDPHSHRPD
jgi:hypothetical protein